MNTLLAVLSVAGLLVLVLMAGGLIAPPAVPAPLPQAALPHLPPLPFTDFIPPKP